MPSPPRVSEFALSVSSVDFHVELTAEVRLEGGSSFALLSSVNSAVQTRKSGNEKNRLTQHKRHEFTIEVPSE